MEVMRDGADNAVIVCSIENFDPMGVHTGDSITVAPAQTLTDKEYQRMRDASLAILRAIGVETGGSNVQFAVDPKTGRMIVIEMNPRVSRSSALASKATGFPIAKIAAKLAVGYRLDEIRNDITRETPACFEPTIDYVVTKVPRWAFEKFPEADPVLTTQMKSVGEVMAIGRTFRESFQKALRGLEVGRFGLGCDKKDPWGTDAAADRGRDQGEAGHPQRRAGLVHPPRPAGRHDRRRGPHPDRDRPLVPAQPARAGPARRPAPRRRAAWSGPTTTCCARPSGTASPTASWRTSGTSARREVRRDRQRRGINAVFKLVDTCAAEFEAVTPYYYSTYEDEDETRRRRQAAGRHPGRRAEPDRPGDRVRLLLLPGRLRAQRRRLRGGHGQLQPRDRQHRLRHLGPALLRAPDGRGRAEHLRAGPADGGDRPVRRPDAAEPGAGPGGGGGADHRHEPREHRPGRGPRAVPR